MSQLGSQALAPLSLGEIAASLPGATAVFRRHKLDFCCGGSQSLEEAARYKGLDPAEIEAELSQLSGEESSLPKSSEGLIRHILDRYHQVHRRELPELMKLAITVEHVHANNPALPAGLSGLIAHMRAALEAHMQKEEQVLFPLLLAGGNPMVVHPIQMMRHEHDEHGENLRTLAVLTSDMTPPEEACSSWRALYAGLAKLAEDLTERIHIENNILFPRFEHASA